MADGARLGSVIMFVHDLDRSVAFYSDVLALRVADRSPTAALLSSAAGAALILRSMGREATHPLGSIGVQYVVWTAAGDDDLDRCQRALEERGALREVRATASTRVVQGQDPADRARASVRVVEGRDPDDIVLMVCYPGPDQVPLDKLPARIYGW